MALVSPFINPIKAFDATIGTTIDICVLGGDAISKYKFRIYKNDGTTTPYYESEWIEISNDTESLSLRRYPVFLGVGLGISNNNTYKIEPITANDSNPNGIVGPQTLFQCYAMPSLSLKHKTLIDGISTLLDVAPGTTFTSSSVDFMTILHRNDINSPIKPNSVEATLYGVDKNGNKIVIDKPKTIYGFKQDIPSGDYYLNFSLSGFSVNVDEGGSPLQNADNPYSHFEIKILFESVEGIVVGLSVDELNCYYKTVDNPSVFNVFNCCNNGVVELRYSLTSLTATSNPIEPIFVNDSEVDLTSSDSWALWQKYFTLSQPFTLRIWGRDLRDGSILLATESSSSGNYIDIAYNTEMYDSQEYAFVSVQCGQVASDGTLMFPYYLESERILKNLITEDTNIFIGVQRKDGLFNIKFQIL